MENLGVMFLTIVDSKEQHSAGKIEANAWWSGVDLGIALGGWASWDSRN